MECPRCGNEMEGERCLWCAYQNTKKSDQGPSDVDRIIDRSKQLLKILTIFSFMGFLVLSVAVMLWSAGIIIPETYGSSTIVFFIFLIYNPWFVATGYQFTIYYIFIIACILISYVYLTYFHVPELPSFLSDDRGPKDDSPISRLAYSFCAMLFLYMVYLVILFSLDVSMRTPGLEDYPTWEMIYAITRASVWEELIIRVVFLGIPMMVYASLKGNSGLLKYLMGGFGVKERFVFWPILFSASIFALAHLPSWDIYKMLPTLMAGFFFGYLYAKDGLYSCILFHFAWNFTSVYSRLPRGWMEMVGLLTLVWILFGIYFTYYFSKRFVAWVVRPVSKIRQPVNKVKDDGEMRKSTAGVNSGFICPNCRNHTAYYMENGMLKCKRCASEYEPTSQKIQEGLNASEVRREWPPPR